MLFLFTKINDKLFDKKKRKKKKDLGLTVNSFIKHVKAYLGLRVLFIRRVYHIVAYLQVGVYHIVTYHDRNFIRKSTSGICRVRKLYRI